MKETPIDQPCDWLIGGSASMTGDRRYNCVVCDGFVWLARSGQDRLVRFPKTLVVCLRCGFKRMKEDPNYTVGTVTRQEIVRDFNMDEKQADELLATADELVKRGLETA